MTLFRQDLDLLRLPADVGHDLRFPDLHIVMLAHRKC